ncbi:MAG: outer membrane beta-barrel protein [Myxococcota bacterium]
MRSQRSRTFGWLLGLALLLPAASPAAELYLAGNIGISSLTGEGTGTNNFVSLTNSGSSNDSSPIYGGSLGMAFPLNEALPWRMNLPGFAVPYWPGRQLRFFGEEDWRFPDWPMRVEIEHLRGRNFDLDTDSFNALEPYRADIDSWSVMGKFRMDLPVRAPINAIFGRVPWLDPLTIYGSGGAGLAFTDLAVSTSLLLGDDDAQEFAWQAGAGVGYQLNERVSWSVGWRFYNLGKVDTALTDTTFTPRGSYSVDLTAQEFTTSLHFAFWRFSLLGED